MRLQSWAMILAACGAVALAGCQFTARGQNLAGVQRFQAGDYQGAQTHFLQAVRTNPGNADAHYNLAALYHRSAEANRDPNLVSLAEKEYQQSLILNPDHLDARHGYTVLLTEANRSAEAFTSLKQWAERNPTSAAPRVELAQLYQQSGDKATTEQLLNQALQIDPNNPRAYAAIGKLRQDSGSYSEALAYYQRAYQLSPTTQVATLQQIQDLQNRGVNATPLAVPLPTGVQTGPRLVNAPGPMRRF